MGGPIEHLFATLPQTYPKQATNKTATKIVALKFEKFVPKQQNLPIIRKIQATKQRNLGHFGDFTNKCEVRNHSKCYPFEEHPQQKRHNQRPESLHLKIRPPHAFSDV